MTERERLAADGEPSAFDRPYDYPPGQEGAYPAGGKYADSAVVDAGGSYHDQPPHMGEFAGEGEYREYMQHVQEREREAAEAAGGASSPSHYSHQAGPPEYGYAVDGAGRDDKYAYAR